MTAADLLVLMTYVIGLMGVGLLLTRMVRTSSDLFSAGPRSPWWMSGLSSFMTMFSAGTFVVWGGLAYRFGLVAVAICLTLGVAGFFVGWTVAGRWRELGVESAAEFIELRYGRGLVQFYTWFQGVLGLFTLGGAIYALAVMVCALVSVVPGVGRRDRSDAC